MASTALKRVVMQMKSRWGDFLRRKLEMPSGPGVVLRRRFDLSFVSKIKYPIQEAMFLD